MKVIVNQKELLNELAKIEDPMDALLELYRRYVPDWDRVKKFEQGAFRVNEQFALDFMKRIKLNHLVWFFNGPIKDDELKENQFTIDMDRVTYEEEEDERVPGVSDGSTEHGTVSESGGEERVDLPSAGSGS